MIKGLACLFVLLSTTVIQILATPQILDILVYDGQEYPIRYAMLEPYFNKFPERNPKNEDWSCSALWRGYQAKFEVLERKIYFRELLSNSCFQAEVSQLKKVVPDGKPLFIDWITDLIQSGYGENMEDPYGIASLDAYEKYSLFEVDKGIIKEVRHFDNSGYRAFKKKQFVAFKKTSQYAETVKKMLSDNPRMNRNDADSNIELWIFSYTSRFLVK